MHVFLVFSFFILLFGCTVQTAEKNITKNETTEKNITKNETTSPAAAPQTNLTSVPKTNLTIEESDIGELDDPTLAIEEPTVEEFETSQ
jgi:hypothetical protein